MRAIGDLIVSTAKMTPQSFLTGISYIKVLDATIQKNVAVQVIF
jgi:hypothetical protein